MARTFWPKCIPVSDVSSFHDELDVQVQQGQAQPAAGAAEVPKEHDEREKANVSLCYVLPDCHGRREKKKKK